MRVAWGSVEFFKRLIRFALFVVLPTALVALIAMTVLYVVQVTGMARRIADLEQRVRTYEASQYTSPTGRLVLQRTRALQANAKLTLLLATGPDEDVDPPGDDAPDASPTPVDLPTPTPTPSPTPVPTDVPTPTPDADLTLLPDFRQTYPTFVATEGKVAYLTFDDGPSARTLEILDILDRYDVKACFFVINHTDPKYAEIMREVLRRGNAIGMHTATHNYTKIYASVEAYVKDLASNYQYILKATGVAPTVYRFAGGSTNSAANLFGARIRAEMARRGFRYYDWNSSSGDGNAANVDPVLLAKNVLSTARGKTRVVVLSHDSYNRTGTVAALPAIIEGLRAQGFRIELLTVNVRPVTFTIKGS